MQRRRHSPDKRVLARVPVRKPFKRRTKPGESPGAVVPLPDAISPQIEAIAFSADTFRRTSIHDLHQLARIRSPDTTLWVNVDGLGSARTIEQLGAMFQLHPLALEDVVHVHQRAKTEEYESHLFIVVRMVTSGERLESEQLSLFLGKDFVVTFQEKPGDCLNPLRHRLEKGFGRLRKFGADFLAYSILDAAVDSYFPVIDELAERLDRLDQASSDSHDEQTISRLHQLRSELLMLRRQIWPHREAIHGLLRSDHDLISDDTRIYLRDSYDHTVQLIDVIEIYRETCTDVRDYHVSMLTNRTNEIMKVLTVIATIFIPLSFITGIYGMNFEYMPELTWRWGYPAALSVMALFGLGLVTYIWRRGWLRR